MDIEGIVPLDEASLIDTAMRNTGLSDFGDDEWREPFALLLRSLNEDAALNMMGRLMCRSDILGFLQGRLQIEDTYRRHPEIGEQEVAQPIFVVGRGRSGTSLLLHLLGQDPDNGAVETWEAMFPCPPPERESYATDPRIAKADKLITQWNRVTPTIEVPQK